MRTARKDYESLSEAGALFSAHLWDVPNQIRKQLDELKAAEKSQQKLLAEIAELRAERLLAEVPEQNGRKLIAQVFPDRNLPFVKLLAQKLTQKPAVVAILAAGSGQPALVFAQAPGMRFDMGALMKDTMTALGARGGGSKDLAQGGVPDASKLEDIVRQIADKLNGSH